MVVRVQGSKYVAARLGHARWHAGTLGWAGELGRTKSISCRGSALGLSWAGREAALVWRREGFWNNEGGPRRRLHSTRW